MLHIVDGVLIPPSQQPQLDFWLANGNGPAKGADAAAAAAAPAPAPATAGAHTACASTAAAILGSALLLAMAI